jgi:uncharacterized protein DUF4105
MARTDTLRASIILLLLSIALPLRAQTNPSVDSVPKVYLVTVEPGDAAWERFGHDMIVIGDINDGAVAVNYGVFDFDAPNFIGNFVRGKMTYWMEGDDWPLTKKMYVGANRSLWLQELNLSPQQRIKLITALQENALPQNKFYRYDYYKNNCTTKVRDAINDAVNGEIYKQLKDTRTGHTYRDHTRIGMAEYFWLYTGLELAMGPPCDVKLSAWQECYLPAQLMDHLKRVTIDDGSGNRVPLLKPTVDLYRSTRAPLPDRPPTWWPWFLLVGIVVGGELLLTGYFRYRKLLILLSIFWSLIPTLASVFLLCLWMFTDHEAGYRNENLWQLSPLSFLVIVAALWGFRWKSARLLVMIPLALSVLGVLLKVLPWFREWNWEMVCLALPAHLGLAAGVMILLKTPMQVSKPKPVTRGRNVNARQ